MAGQIPNKPVNVYVVTRHGNALNNDGVKTITEMALARPGVPDDITGALVRTGPDLLDASALATLARETPGALIGISMDGGMRLVLFEPLAKNGTRVADILERAAKNGMTNSWDALVSAMGDGDGT